jgi:hypothetical protein
LSLFGQYLFLLTTRLHTNVDGDETGFIFVEELTVELCRHQWSQSH